MLESQIEKSFIEKLSSELKYVYREDIHDRETLEANFREKFQALNRVHLTDNEFGRLLDEITNPDVFVSSKRLREHCGQGNLQGTVHRHRGRRLARSGSR